MTIEIDSLVKSIFDDYTRNGFTTIHDKFIKQFNNLEDKDKKQTVKELNRRGLVSDVTAKQRKFGGLGYDIEKEVVKSIEDIVLSFNVEQILQYETIDNFPRYKQALNIQEV